MQSIYIKDYDTTVDFPDDTSPEVMQQALQRQFPAKSGGAPAPQSNAPAPNNVPQWGQDSPNLYGVAGAAYETLSPLAEALGLVGGGLVGAPAGPLGSVAGAGLGYGASQRLKKAAGGVLGILPPESPLQALVNTGKETAAGAAMEAGGQAVGNLAGRGLQALLERKPTPGMYERLALAEKTGVPTTAADIRQSKPLMLIDAQLDRNLASSGLKQQFRNKQMDAMNALKEGILNKQGGGLSPNVAGIEAQTVAKRNADTFKELSDEAYGKVADFIPKGEPIPTPTLAKTADDLATDLAQSKLARGDMHEVLRKLREPAGVFNPGKPAGKMDVEYTVLGEGAEGKALPGTGGQGKTLYGDMDRPKIPAEWEPFQDQTWQGLNMDRKWLTSEIQKAWKSGDNFKAAIYGKLKNAIDADLSGYSESIGGGAKEAFDWANQLFNSGANVFRDKRILGDLIRNNAPERVMDLFLRPNNTSRIKLLKEAVGDEGIQPLKQSWLEKLFTKGEEQSFSPAKFATAWDKYDKDTLLSFLKPQEYSQLKELAQVSRMLQKVEKAAGNASGTAQQMETAGTIIGAIRHPVLTAATMIGGNRFANLYLNNPSFRNYLIHGLKVSPKAPKAAEYATKLFAIASGEE